MASFLALALRQAARSKCRHKVGAVLVKGSRVLGQAPNSQRSTNWVDFKYATFHAEEMLLRRFHPPNGATVYVARIDSQGRPALARPCLRCQKILSSGGIALVHYTAPTGPGALRLPS